MDSSTSRIDVLATWLTRMHVESKFTVYSVGVGSGMLYTFQPTS
jgi:hypothetical protein